MPSSPDTFWTDPIQANERLQNTYVMLGESPVLVERVTEENIARLVIYPKRERKNVPLSDKAFNKFRVLPPLGWTNLQEGRRAVYMARRPRRSRLHGLNGDNVTISRLEGSGQVYNNRHFFDDVVADPGYVLTCKKDYPPLERVLGVLRADSSIAISSLYSVFRDNTGLRWLYRNLERIGLFSGVDTLLLFEKCKYLREELAESAEITVKAVKEF